MPELAAIRIAVELIAILALLSLNGLFALSEIAVVSANRTKLQQLASQNQRAKNVIQLAEEPTAFLSTVQIGITLIGILAGALSGATLSSELGAILARVTWLSAYAEVISFTMVVALVTLLSLLIGELIPKSIALSNPERFAMAVAPMMQFLARITAPIVALLTMITESALRLLRIEPNDEPSVSEEGLKTLLTEGAQAGVFEPMEEQFVIRALELDDISLRSVLTHRTQVAWLNINDSIEQWVETIAEHPFAAYPLCDGSMDSVMGVVRAKDLLLFQLLQLPDATLQASLRAAPLRIDDQSAYNGAVAEPRIGSTTEAVSKYEGLSNIESMIQPAMFVPATVSPSSLLAHLQDRQTTMIFAVDEYGGIEGLVTQSDIFARLTGACPTLTKH